MRNYHAHIEHMAPNLTLSEAAVTRIKDVVQKKNATALRIKVSGGGCSGFQYHFSLDTEKKADDIEIARDGARVWVDPHSLPLIATSEIDYVEDVMGSSFRLNNPNATASCGCGTSFSVF